MVSQTERKKKKKRRRTNSCYVETYAFHWPPLAVSSRCMTPKRNFVTIQLYSLLPNDGSLDKHVIKKLRVKGTLLLSEMPEEGQLYYYDEQSLGPRNSSNKNNNHNNHNNKNNNNNKDDKSRPPSDIDDGWKLARKFWLKTSGEAFYQWQKVSVPEKPPSRWWKLVLFAQPGRAYSCLEAISIQTVTVATPGVNPERKALAM